MRLSLRTLLVLVLVFGGWLGWVAREARIQREAVAALLKADAIIWYDWECEDGHLKTRPKTKDVGKPSGPAWLVKALGVDYFNSVAAVNVFGRPTDPRRLSDEQLAHVGRLRGLGEVKFVGMDVTGPGLAPLEGKGRLLRLNLSGSRLDDADLAHLEGLANLRELNLSYTRVGRAGLAHLKGLTRLRLLDLSNTSIGEAAVGELRRARPDLEILR